MVACILRAVTQLKPDKRLGSGALALWAVLASRFTLREGGNPFTGEREIQVLTFLDVERSDANEVALGVEEATSAGTGRNGGGGLNDVGLFVFAQAGDEPFGKSQFKALG